MAFSLDDPCFAERRPRGWNAARAWAPGGFGEGVMALLVGGPARLLAQLRVARYRRLTASALNRLDNHTLDDIGISRAEIRAVADGLARDIARSRRF